MNKDTITIDGETYVKQSSPADAGPSKKEIETANKLATKATLACLTGSFLTSIILSFASTNSASQFISFVFMFIFSYTVSWLLTRAFYLKRHISEETLDAITPAYQPSSGSCMTDPHYRHISGNIYNHD